MRQLKRRIAEAAIPLLLFSLLACAISAQSTKPNASRPAVTQPASHAEIDRLIQQLGSDSFADREEAQKELVEIGAPAMEALRKAATGQATERATRAQAALQQIQAQHKQIRDAMAKAARATPTTVPAASVFTEYKWSWLQQPTTGPQLGTWEEELKRTGVERAKGLKQDDFLRLYQRLLDANPPPAVELMARMEMAAGLNVYFSEPRQKEEVAWLVQMIIRFQGLSNHRSHIVARMYLATALRAKYGRKYQTLIESLWQSVIDTPPDVIVFDSGIERTLNLEEIEVAQAEKYPEGWESNLPDDPNIRARILQEMDQMNHAYRLRLLEERKEATDLLHKAGVDGLKRFKEPGSSSPRELPFQDEAYQRELDRALRIMEQSLQAAATRPASKPATIPSAAAAP